MLLLNTKALRKSRTLTVLPDTWEDESSRRTIRSELGRDVGSCHVEVYCSVTGVTLDAWDR